MNASLDVVLDRTADASLPPSQLPIFKVLRRPIEFTQYGSDQYQDQLKNYKMRCSMSRPGKCGDNAVAESFFRTIKTESLYHMDLQTREEARLAIFDYIEGFYNRTRMHSTLDYQSPEEYERLSAA